MIESDDKYSIVFSLEFEEIIKSLKKRKPVIYDQVVKQILKISHNPTIGKPLRNLLRNYRRVHIGSHVLIYEIYNFEIRFVDFDHHDRIYKR